MVKEKQRIIALYLCGKTVIQSASVIDKPDKNIAGVKIC